MSVNGSSVADIAAQEALRPDTPRSAGQDVAIAALYVAKGGCYFGLPHVDPWDQSRDARLYDGPHGIVAHPPCERWGRYWGGSPTTFPRLVKGDDHGCFAAALASVRKWGGVLEHPADSAAWAHFRLSAPNKDGGWTRCDWLDGFDGWTCHIEQGAYGHKARKATWLYASGVSLPDLKWGRAEGDFDVFEDGFHSAAERAAFKADPDNVPWAKARARAVKTGICQKLSAKQCAATPLPFRDLLLSIAATTSRDEPMTARVLKRSAA